MRKIEVDEYVISTLMRDLVGHDRQPSAYLLYLYLWWLTEQAPGGGIEVSLHALAEGTGLSKRAVQDAGSGMSNGFRELIDLIGTA